MYIPACKSHELHHFPISIIRGGGPIPCSEDSRMMEDTTDISPKKNKPGTPKWRFGRWNGWGSFSFWDDVDYQGWLPETSSSTP